MSSPTSIIDHSINVPNAGQPIVFFTVVTAIVFFLSYNTRKIPKTKKNQYQDYSSGKVQQIMYLVIYIGVLIIGNYFINITVSQEICGNPNWVATFISTVVPWMLIFTILLFLLKLLPEWLIPFSNTIGYLVANLFGLKKTIFQIIKSPDLISDLNESPQQKPAPQPAPEEPSVPANPLADTTCAAAPGSPEVTKQFGKRSLLRRIRDKMPPLRGGKRGGAAPNIVTYNLQHIYSDPSLLINEITTSNFPQFIINFNEAKLFNNENIEIQEGKGKYLYRNLYNYLVLKDTISEFIWYFLTGLLVCSVSYNYIVNNSCNSSLQEMEATHDAYLRLQQQQENQNSQDTTTYDLSS